MDTTRQEDGPAYRPPDALQLSMNPARLRRESPASQEATVTCSDHPARSRRLPDAFRELPDVFLSARRPFSPSRRPSSVPRRFSSLPERPSCLPDGLLSFPDRRPAFPRRHPALPSPHPSLPRRHSDDLPPHLAFPRRRGRHFAGILRLEAFILAPESASKGSKSVISALFQLRIPV